MKKLPQAPLRTGYIELAGGLDTETPPLSTTPGTLKDSKNVYQGVRGGYITATGYERFDGRTSPSSATYSMLSVTSATTAEAGDTITEAGGASGVVLHVDNDGLKTLVLTKVSGTFSDGDILLVGGSPAGEAIADIGGGASTSYLSAYYESLAADKYRADITAPTGSGPTLGGFEWGGSVYVFRNAADGLSANMWKSSSSGWVQVDLGYELSFTSGGTYEPSEGQTVTGATSGATATVGRIILTSGTWAGGDASGRLVLTEQTGTFASENLNIGLETNVMTIGGDSAAIELAPSGRYEFIVANFTADPTTERVYGIDGVNYGFEFSGTVFVQIHTGMTADAPDKVCAHMGHLCYAFGGSFQNSSLGDPYDWTPYLGAAEIGLSDPITNFKGMPGSEGAPVLAITSANSIHMLYGSTRDDWTLVPFRYEAGALSRSVQQVGQAFMCDTRGITTLSASQAFGNFQFATVSERIQEWISARKTTLTDSCISRPNNQYRLFFSDGSALYGTVTVNKNGTPNISAFLPMYFTDKVRWVWSSENSSGNERIYFGDDAGMVYQMDKGTSSDGDALEWYFETHPVNFSSPNTYKKWRRCTVEMDGSGYADYWFNFALGYGASTIEQPARGDYEVTLSASVYDDGEAAYDSDYFYDGIPISPERYALYGNAQNIALSFGGNNAYSSPIRFSGALILYSLARELR